MTRASFRTPRRIVPAQAKALRGRCVMLGPGRSMPWHSTDEREELLILLRGRVQIHARSVGGRVLRRSLTAGQCAFVRSRTPHQVVNVSRRPAHYLYVTAPAA